MVATAVGVEANTRFAIKSNQEISNIPSFPDQWEAEVIMGGFTHLPGSRLPPLSFNGSTIKSLKRPQVGYASGVPRVRPKNQFKLSH